jgi:hypothetical protein
MTSLNSYGNSLTRSEGLTKRGEVSRDGGRSEKIPTLAQRLSVTAPHDLSGIDLVWWPTLLRCRPVVDRRCRNQFAAHRFDEAPVIETPGTQSLADVKTGRV